MEESRRVRRLHGIVADHEHPDLSHHERRILRMTSEITRDEIILMDDQELADMHTTADKHHRSLLGGVAGTS